MEIDVASQCYYQATDFALIVDVSHFPLTNHPNHHHQSASAIGVQLRLNYHRRIVEK